MCLRQSIRYSESIGRQAYLLGTEQLYAVLSGFCIFTLAHTVCKFVTNYVLHFRKRYREKINLDYNKEPAIFQKLMQYCFILQWSFGSSIVRQRGVCCLPAEVSDGIGLVRWVGLVCLMFNILFCNVLFCTAWLRFGRRGHLEEWGRGRVRHTAVCCRVSLCCNCANVLFEKKPFGNPKGFV